MDKILSYFQPPTILKIFPPVPRKLKCDDLNSIQVVQINYESILCNYHGKGIYSMRAAFWL